MTFTTRKVAAVAAATALAISGATGVANAQSEVSLDAGSLSGGSGELSSGSEGSGDSAGNGSVPEDLGSLILDGNATGNGSLDTEGSLIGEPTTGSLSGSLSEAIASSGVNSLSPAPGTGSITTTDSLLGEPTTGSLAPIYAPIAGSLGIGEGATTVLGSMEGSLGAGSLPGGTGSLVPATLGLGSVAAIGAGIYFAPEIHAALTAAGIALPPLPPLPWAPAQGAAPAPAPAPAPGPAIDNGRG